jgi:hypothetical protein
MTPEQRQLYDNLQERVKIEDERRDPRLTPKRPGLAPGLPEGPTKQGIDLNLIDEAQRLKTRAWVQSLPPVLGFIVEALPATIGTAIGAIFGGPTGGGPIVSRGLALVGKGTAKSISGATKILPPTRVALARKAMQDAASEFESQATKIIAGRVGLIRTSAKTLYKIANEAGVRIPGFRLTTKAAFKPLLKELNGMRALPEVRQAIRLIEDVQKTLVGPGHISYAELISAKEMVGVAIKRAKFASGKSLGAEKQFFKAIMSDFEYLAGLGGKTGNVAKIAMMASRRAKLDFAVKELEQGAANFITYLPGKNITTMNVGKYRDWIKNISTPSHKNYNKNLVESLGDDLPALQERLRVLTMFGEGTPGGPGSLIIRGKGAGVGAAIGYSMFGTVGAGFGTILGAASPEMATAIFSSPTAIKYLEKIAAIGGGQISWRAWDVAGQIAAQGLKQIDPNRKNQFQSPAFGLTAPKQRVAPPLGGLR